MDKETLINYVSCDAFNMLFCFAKKPEIIEQGGRRHG